MFSYDPTTGQFSPPGISQFNDRCELEVLVDGIWQPAAEVAWELTYGAPSDAPLAFLDRDKGNCCIENLVPESDLGDEITPAALRALIDYDPTAGTLLHRERPLGMFKSPAARKAWNATYAGREATVKMGRNRFLNIYGRSRPASRMAWLYQYGVEPQGNLRFADGDCTNFKGDNLQLAASLETQIAAKLRGVDLKRGQWRGREFSVDNVTVIRILA